MKRERVIKSINNIDISSKLTKDEMKRIMAGSGCGNSCSGSASGACGGCRCDNAVGLCVP